MLYSRGFLLLVCLFLLGPAVHAQDMDYLKHRKVFDLCSMKRQCFDCNSCGEERYLVKIKNSADRKITQVFYKFYSQPFNRILEKEAKIEGNKIDAKQTGLLYVCVLDGRHWIISRIVYDDGSSQSFIVHERLENFLQEPDECDCND